MLSFVVHGPYNEDETSEAFGRLIRSETDEAVATEREINDMTEEEASAEVKAHSEIGPERFTIDCNCTAVVVEIGTFGKPINCEFN